MKWYFPIFLHLILSTTVFAQNGSTPISGLTSLYQKAENESYLVLARKYDEQIAVLTEKAALANAFSLKAPVSANAINNTLIPVNFIPGEIFGGPAGSFKEVQFGQQYISSLAFSPQIDLLQPARIAEVPMSKTQHKLVQLQTDQAIVQLKNELALRYYSILAYRMQNEWLKKAAHESDSLYQLIEFRKEKGLASEQELNDSRIYAIQQKLEFDKLQYVLALQMEYLNALFTDSVQISNTEALADLPLDAPSAKIQLGSEIAGLQFTYAKQNLRKVQLDQLPGLSLMSNFAWQNNSNSRLFDPSQRWIQSQYVGLKFNWDLPVSASRITSLSLSKISSNQAKLNAEQANKQTFLQQAKLETDYTNARTQWLASEEIASLEASTFVHVKNRYDSGLIDTEDLLRAHRKVIQSKLNAIAAKSAALIALENIRNAR
jgi:outer membrane protein TolC